MSKAMKEGKLGLVPRLRFPEFQEAGEWEEKPLSQLIAALDAGVSVNSGGRPATEDEKGILKTSAVTDGVFNPSENKVDAERLTEQMAQLPPNRQIEVADFIQFLLQREQQRQQREEAHEWQNLMLAQADSFTDWDNAEDEVWNNVPAV